MTTKRPKTDSADAPSLDVTAPQAGGAQEREGTTRAAVRKVAFTMLPVQDVERARRFYEDLLGLRVGLHGGQGGMWWVEYDLPGGGCIALTNTTGAVPSANAGATLALEVQDLGALVDQLKSAGVSFRGGVVRGPRCHMITCLDSEGNALLLHQLDHA